MLAVLGEQGRPYYRTRDYGRAVLHGGVSSAEHAAEHVRGKVLKEHRRLRARLNDRGALVFERLAVGEPVDASLKDEAELKAKIESVAAAVELPDLSFTDMKLLKAMDINASAISSKAWILGKRIPLADAPDLNELVPVMTLDGVEATRGRGSDALGDPWKALLWLVNKMVEEG